MDFDPGSWRSIPVPGPGDDRARKGKGGVDFLGSYAFSGSWFCFKSFVFIALYQITYQTTLTKSELENAYLLFYFQLFTVFWMGTSYLAKHDGPGGAVASNTLGSPGGDLLTRKCFQCHGDGTWRDLRLDLRGWTGVLYRMVGRGALWTEEEIAGMAEYLAQANGPESAEGPQM